MTNHKIISMKTRILFVALFVAMASFATAQEKKKCDKPTPEQRIEFRVKRMQQKLMLDDKKGAEFAALYKEYLAEMTTCRPNITRGKELSDAEIKGNIEARMNARQKALDIEKKYYSKLSKVLNARQLQVVFGEKQGFKKGGDKKFAHRKGKPGDRGSKKGFKPGVKTDCKK